MAEAIAIVAGFTLLRVLVLPLGIVGAALLLLRLGRIVARWQARPSEAGFAPGLILHE